MKILVVCQHYWPEPYPLSNLCEELVKRGHSVHVVTDVPNYPHGIIYDEYKHGENRNQIHNGVKITRTFTIGRRKNVLFRLLNYYSFAISSTIHTMQMKDEYDVVLAYQTSPVMMSSAALQYAKKHGKKCVLYCMDLWPASLTVGGIKENSILFKVFHRVSKKIYRKADKLLVSSVGFIDYLYKEFQIEKSNISYLPQFAEKIYLSDLEKEEDQKINLVFAGNIGKAQSIPTIIKAAEQLKHDKNIIWHIVGDGSEFEYCQKMAEGLENVIFHGFQQEKELEEFYKTADVMLITLMKDSTISLTLPLKMMSYMASGKPIIAAADGEIQRIIDEAQCGYAVPAENPQLLANAVQKIKSDNRMKEYGKKAREYYLKYFTKERYLDDIEKYLKDACNWSSN